MHPGLHVANYTPGETLAFVKFADEDRLPRRLKGEGVDIPIDTNPANLPVPSRPGAYSLLDANGKNIHGIRVNSVSPAESDLRLLAKRDQDTRTASESRQGDTPLKPRDLSWLALLLAVCAFGLNWTMDRIGNA
jgi:hypothetical protein